MNSRILRKLLAGAVVLGLSGTFSVAVSASADAATTCDYPSSIVTTTTLSLDTATAPYGQPIHATATVASGAGTPTGVVKFRVDGVLVGLQSLSGGMAKASLVMKAGADHKVRAIYVGNCDWARSADHALATVTQASTSTLAYAHKIKSGHRPRINAGVTSETGVRVRGKVVFLLIRNHHLIGRDVVRLRRGVASPTFKHLKLRRIYKVVVKYRGTHNFAASKDVTFFKVV